MEGEYSVVGDRRDPFSDYSFSASGGAGGGAASC